MASYEKLSIPKNGQKISHDKNNCLVVPDQPIIPFIVGDGIGEDIWPATKMVIDAAVKKVFKDNKKISWFEIFAGQKAQEKYGQWLPEDTIKAIADYLVAIKGPLTTPVGGGFRSLNVALRQILDLYACVRPVRYFKGVPSPVKAPEKMNIVIFRENTEDVYAGIEYQSGTKEADQLRQYLIDRLSASIRENSGIGIKPISPFGSKRLIGKAIRYAIERGRDSVTLVHKGNIMKFTEGAFKDWGYELAREEYAKQTISEANLYKDFAGKLPPGKIVIKDRIADSMFQQILTRASEYSVLATPNLDGDYLSDAAAAQVGGLGLAPGANLGDQIALFEATHGTAPKYAGQDKVNPGSLILSGVMMLEHLGWQESAAAIIRGLERTIEQKKVTYDLERQMSGATKLSCSAFAEAIVENM